MKRSHKSNIVSFATIFDEGSQYSKEVRIPFDPLLVTASLIKQNFLILQDDINSYQTYVIDRDIAYIASFPQPVFAISKDQLMSAIFRDEKILVIDNFSNVVSHELYIPFVIQETTKYDCQGFFSHNGRFIATSFIEYTLEETKSLIHFDVWDLLYEKSVFSWKVETHVHQRLLQNVYTSLISIDITEIPCIKVYYLEEEAEKVVRKIHKFDIQTSTLNIAISNTRHSLRMNERFENVESLHWIGIGENQNIDPLTRYDCVKNELRDPDDYCTAIGFVIGDQRYSAIISGSKWLEIWTTNQNNDLEELIYIQSLYDYRGTIWPPILPEKLFGKESYSEGPNLREVPPEILPFIAHKLHAMELSPEGLRPEEQRLLEAIQKKLSSMPSSADVSESFDIMQIVIHQLQTPSIKGSIAVASAHCKNIPIPMVCLKGNQANPVEQDLVQYYENVFEAACNCLNQEVIHFKMYFCLPSVS